MKNIQYYIACIGFLSLHTSYAHNQTLNPQEDSIQPATIEDKIIQKGNRVKLWKMLLKRIVHHQTFLTKSQNIALKETTEWEAFYLEVLPLFDDEIKRYILAIIDKNTMLPSLEEVLKNKLSSFDITTMLSIPIKENKLQEASVDEIAVQEEQTLEQFLIERALLLAKEAERNPIHETLEEQPVKIDLVQPIDEIDYVKVEIEPLENNAPHTETTTKEPTETGHTEETITEDPQLEPQKTSSENQEPTDKVAPDAKETPYIDLSADEETTENTDITTETSPQTEEASQDILPKTTNDDRATINTPSSQALARKSEHTYYGLIALVALLLLLGILFFLRRKKK